MKSRILKLPSNRQLKKIGIIGENYWLFFKKSRLDNSSNFSRFLTRNYIVFLVSHEKLKTEKNDMPTKYIMCQSPKYENGF